MAVRGSAGAGTGGAGASGARAALANTTIRRMKMTASDVMRSTWPAAA
jgi:hypothetical protein